MKLTLKKSPISSDMLWPTKFVLVNSMVQTHIELLVSWTLSIVWYSKNRNVSFGSWICSLPHVSTQSGVSARWTETKNITIRSVAHHWHWLNTHVPFLRCLTCSAAIMSVKRHRTYLKSGSCVVGGCLMTWHCCSLHWDPPTEVEVLEYQSGSVHVAPCHLHHDVL